MPLYIGIDALQEARASAALPAAGAWDTPTELNVSGAQWITTIFTYTRGAAGGAFDWQMEHSIYSLAANVPAGANEWSDESVLQLGVVAAGVDTQNLIQECYTTYTSNVAGADSFSVGQVELGGTIERVRFRCRESGVVGTPGTLQIEIQIH